MGRFGVGQPVRRIEDPRLVSGGGRYTDDLFLPGQLYGFVLRSPYAHAEIARIDTSIAASLPGIVRIFTHADIAAAGLGSLPCSAQMKSSDGSLLKMPRRPILADGRVRHVGEAVAFIVAETLDQARDAAEAIAIEYHSLPVIAYTAGAIDPSAPQIWPEAPGNLCLDWSNGDAARVDQCFDDAAHVVALRLINNRIVSNPMEPRNALAQYQDGRWTLYTGSQGVHGLRAALAKAIFDVPEDRIQVVTGDVGGGFGTKIFPYPEHALTMLAAQQLGRPVKWTGERSDAFLGDAHGRDNVTTAALAVAADGRFLAMRVETIANLGAYLSPFGPFVITAAGTGMLPGLYRFDAVSVRVRGVFTNTMPVDAYRGAGRPEAAYVVERMVDHAARTLGIDPAELRRINFIRPEDMPYRTALGHTYDSGEFATLLDLALSHADAAGFPARKAAARAQGQLLGLGVASYVEACAGGGSGPEEASITVEPDGRITLLIGTQTNGQGHETAYAQIIADRLGVTPDQVTVIQGDSDRIAFGKGTGGSRSVPVGGVACDGAAVKVIEKAQRLASHYLEAAVSDLEFAEGSVSIIGTDRRMTLADIAARADSGDLPEGEEPGLGAVERFQATAPTYPNGTHVVELAIDLETSVPQILRYTVVDDFGIVVNPLMLAGQVHGGIAQGIGQALYEDCVFDPESGQLLSGSFMDYTMPRADHLPLIDFATHAVPCRTNPMGIKGAGEAGAIGAPPAVINAVIDALSEFGIEHIDMPATPLKIWQAIQATTDQDAAA